MIGVGFYGLIASTYMWIYVGFIGQEQVEEKSQTQVEGRTQVHGCYRSTRSTGWGRGRPGTLQLQNISSVTGSAPGSFLPLGFGIFPPPALGQ